MIPGDPPSDFLHALRSGRVFKRRAWDRWWWHWPDEDGGHWYCRAPEDLKATQTTIEMWKLEDFVADDFIVGVFPEDWLEVR